MAASRFRRPTKHRVPQSLQPGPGRRGYENPEGVGPMLRDSRRGLVNAPRAAQAAVRRAFKVLAGDRRTRTLCGVLVTDRRVLRKWAEGMVGR